MIKNRVQTKQHWIFKHEHMGRLDQQPWGLNKQINGISASKMVDEVQRRGNKKRSTLTSRHGEEQWGHVWTIGSCCRLAG